MLCVGVVEAPEFVALFDELQPAGPIGAHRAEGDRLTDHHQPLPGPGHGRVEEL